MMMMIGARFPWLVLFLRDPVTEENSMASLLKAVTMAVEGVVDVASQVTGFPKPQV